MEYLDGLFKEIKGNYNFGNNIFCFGLISVNLNFSVKLIDNSLKIV